MPDASEVLTRPAPPPDLTLRYGPDAEHVVDVRLPPGDGPAPLVVVVHGGFWRAAYDRAHAGPQSVALAAAGYAVATVEYRRVGTPGGGWPGTLDDVALLTDTVPGLVAEATDRRADAARVALVGHSAGGHLALWAAARHRLPASSRWHRAAALPVRGVVSLAGVGDLALADELHLGDDATRALLGGSAAEQPQRYAEANPAALLPAGAAILVHGTADQQVPVEVSRCYVERARTSGAPVQLRELAGTAHFELIDPLTRAWPVVLDAVAELTA